MPGNGGLRLWHYENDHKAQREAVGLGLGMALKHSTYNTGFAGAKLICAAASPPHTWGEDDKKELLREVAAMLTTLDGKMYTGCDMNTTTEDMDYLSELCLSHGGRDYVLAAIGNKACCPNTATAYGVFGAVEATLGGSVAGKRLLVHGCGGVGSVVARLLVEHGAAHIATLDTLPERADLAGCANVSHEPEWWAAGYDAIVPCSASGLFTEERVLRAGAVVGATNLPFSSRAAQDVAEASLTFVPEGVSSAGAVIVDSVEHYSRKQFAEAPPEMLYEFTRETVRAKTLELLDAARRAGVAPSAVVADIAEPRDTDPIGRRFEAWAKYKQDEEQARTMAAAAAEARASIIGRYAAKAMDIHANALSNLVLQGGGARVAGARAYSSGAPRCAPAGRRTMSSSAAGVARWRSTQSFASSAVSEHSADAVIVGAGIMGLNIAYQLRRRDPNAKIVVLEQAPVLGFGSSGYSTGFQVCMLRRA
mmetsp:Transcript_19913/g.60411  ORF Transcript_19913/g.60411 Transcript_19913/m.60411 type:complete len:479 (-) Transcript_19913:2148-3584(-)